MFQKLIENFLEYFEVWSLNFCCDVVAETRNSRNFGCPKNGFQVSKMYFNFFFLETFFRCFPWLLNMSKVYLTCFEFNMGPISAYKRSVTPAHWQKMTNLQGSKKWISDTQNPKFCFSLKIRTFICTYRTHIELKTCQIYLGHVE